MRFYSSFIPHPSSFPPAPPACRFLCVTSVTASPPCRSTGYGDGFRMICVTFCVTAVSPEFHDGDRGVATRESRAIDQFGTGRIVVRVFAACRGFVSRTRWSASPRFRDGAGSAGEGESRAIDQFGTGRIIVRVFAACRGFVSRTRWSVSPGFRDGAGGAGERESQAIGQFRSATGRAFAERKTTQSHARWRNPVKLGTAVKSLCARA
jgi:hypothetical protein